MIDNCLPPLIKGDLFLLNAPVAGPCWVGQAVIEGEFSLGQMREQSTLPSEDDVAARVGGCAESLIGLVGRQIHKQALHGEPTIDPFLGVVVTSFRSGSIAEGVTLVLAYVGELDDDAAVPGDEFAGEVELPSP